MAGAGRKNNPPWREGGPMKGAVNRRTVLAGAGAGAAVTTLASGVRIARAADPVKVGVLFPLTGNAAAAGQASKAAVEIAAEIVNNAHPELASIPLAKDAGLPGLGGAKLELTFIDHQGNPSVAQQQALRLATQDKMHLLFGAYQSSCTFTATPIAERYGIPFVVGDSAALNITGRGFKWVFRVTPIATDYANTYMRFIADIGQGLMNRSAWDIGKPGSTTFKINEMYKAKTGRDLDDTSGRNMQAALAMAEAINRAGSTDPAKLQAAFKATDLKPEQLMMGYRGVKFDETGQNILASTYLIQLKAKQYELVWPESAAQTKLVWPMKGWK